MWHERLIYLPIPTGDATGGNTCLSVQVKIESGKATPTLTTNTHAQKAVGMVMIVELTTEAAYLQLHISSYVMVDVILIHT